MLEIGPYCRNEGFRLKVSKIEQELIRVLGMQAQGVQDLIREVLLVECFSLNVTITLARAAWAAATMCRSSGSGSVIEETNCS